MPIELDVTNLMASRVGADHGVTEEERDRLAAQAAAVHARLEELRRSGQLAFMDLPERTQEIEVVRAVAEERRGRFRNCVVLGIGGSALGTIAVHTALQPLLHNLKSDEGRGGVPRLFVLDNIDPDWIGEFLDELDPADTLFNVISKSGGTAETVAQFLIFREVLRERLGEEYAKNLVITTDAEKGPLRAICRREDLPSLVVPDGVGGRFSVLTAVGLFPLAMAGVDIDGLLAGAAAMGERCSSASLDENPAYLHGGLLYLLDRKKGKRIHVLMPYAQSLRDLADWFRQLWAESLGKRLAVDGSVVHVGPTPVKALGATDQHSQLQLYAEGPFDKVITFLRVEAFRRELRIPEAYPDLEGIHYLGGHTLNDLITAEQKGTMVALSESRRPNSTLVFPKVDAYGVGEFLMMMEIQTAFAGGLYGIDPFDQPGVEASKVAAYALLGRRGFEERRREIEEFLRDGSR
jgi:glucose-6-phosphate isomerase